MRTMKAFYAASMMLLAAACSPESSTLMAQAPTPEPEKVEIPQYDKVDRQKFNWITEDGGNSQFDFNPQVDILFVTDNSESMKSAQENLVKNLDRFTNGINKNKMIDYQIGVISTWDSRTFGTKQQGPYNIGDLRYMKNSANKSFNQRFVNKAYKSYLSPTLNIGVASFQNGGPQHEEFFAPLQAALEKSKRGGVNEDFFRENSQLVVIIMTDADESSTQITPEQMARTLRDFKGGNAKKLSVYGVLVKKNDPDDKKDWALRIHPDYNPQCFDMTGKIAKNNGTCTGFGPERIEQLIVLANEEKGSPDSIKAKYVTGITSKDFGTDLGKIGDNITIKTLAKEIFLSQRPRVETDGTLQVRVRYGTPDVLAKGGGQIIPNKTKGGWAYDPENNSVKLSGDVQYEYKESARFAVDLVPLTLAK